MSSEDDHAIEDDVSVLDDLLQDAVNVEMEDEAAGSPSHDESGGIDIAVEDILDKLDSITLSSDDNERAVPESTEETPLVVQESAEDQVTLLNDESVDVGVDSLSTPLPVEEPVLVEATSTDLTFAEASEEAATSASITAVPSVDGVFDLIVSSDPEEVATTTSDVDDEPSGESIVLEEPKNVTTMVEPTDPSTTDGVDVDDAGDLTIDTATDAPHTNTDDTNLPEIDGTVESYASTPNHEVQTDDGVDISTEAAPSPRHSSSSGSWEAVAIPDNEGGFVSPPPAPSSLPVFSGSMNPEGIETDGNEHDEASDSDEDSVDDEEDPPLPPPLNLGIDRNDDDEELEVNPDVAAEILATKTTDRSEVPSKNPLLDALEQIDGVAKQLTADVMQAHASKLDEIGLTFEGDATTTEVRAAHVVAHPESSAVVFGIGYQNLRKRESRHEDTGHTFSITTTSDLHELEHEVSLASDLSQSLATGSVQSTDSTDDTDEFGELLTVATEVPVSPTRVDTILQKSRSTIAARSAKHREQELLKEMKAATELEKARLQAPSEPEHSSTTDIDNALTVKELHSMYKRGLGDQEVAMLDDDDDTADPHNTSTEVDSKTTPSPSLSVMGRILSKKTIAEQAIAEEAEEDDADDDDDNTHKHDNRESQDDAMDNLSLDDDDAHAVPMDSDKIDLTVGERRVSATVAKDDEWNEIQLLRKVSSAGPAMAADVASTRSTITYAEALRYFMESADVLVHRDRIVAEEIPTASCFSCLTRPRLTFAQAIDQRDRVFCAAATSFDAHNAIHVRMLQTIYRKLTSRSSTASDVPLMGGHWESIGFQGTDPSTDLRGCGVLSLLQLLHLTEAHSELARRFHSVSQHPVRHFPMACASINVTLQCLMALRSGALYRECNKRKHVFDAVNALHVALSTALAKELPTSSDQIPIVMKRVLDHGRLHPDRAMETYAGSASSTATTATPPPHTTPTSTRGMRASTRKSSAAAGSSHAAEFTEIGLQSVDDE